MPVIITNIKTTEPCHYGCGKVAKFRNKSGKLMCSKSSNSCPAIRLKNAASGKAAYATEKRISAKQLYDQLPQESKDSMAWSRGKTSTTDNRIKSGEENSNYGKLWGSAITGHSRETKNKLSKFKTAWLKNPENHKKICRRGKSWMELCFEKWLNENNILDWKVEQHFFNEDLQKNYFVDFLFEDKKLIIELDGTQHRKTVDQDKIRDEHLASLGYTVIRIQHDEFKKRYFGNNGFMDLLGV